MHQLLSPCCSPPCFLCHHNALPLPARLPLVRAMQQDQGAQNNNNRTANRRRARGDKGNNNWSKREQPAGYIDPASEPFPFWGANPQGSGGEQEEDGLASTSELGWTQEEGGEVIERPAIQRAGPEDRELQAALKRKFPWLHTPRATQAMGAPLRNEYAQTLLAALPLLSEYDIASTQGRPPHIGPGPHQIIEPSLTARAAARWEATQRTPRTLSNEAFITTSDPTASTTGQADSGTDLNSGDAVVLPQTLLPPHSTQAVADNRWVRREADQASYLAYMHELRRALGLPALQAAASNAVLGPGGATSKRQRKLRQQSSGSADTPVQETQGQQGSQRQQTQQQGVTVQLNEAEAAQLDAQLQYQVGICDDWLQLRHLAFVFGDVLGPGTAAALYKRTTAVVSTRVVAAWGGSERLAFIAFRARLAQCAARVMHQMLPKHVGIIAYGYAATEQLQQTASGVPKAEGSSVLLPPLNVQGSPTAQPTLLTSLCAHANHLLQQEQQRQGVKPKRASRSAAVNETAETATTAAVAGSVRGIGNDRSGSVAGSVQGGSDADEGNQWQPADYAQLLWGVGSVGHVPPKSLLQRVCSACYLGLDCFQPAQLWGLLWGVARLSRACGFIPERRWMSRFLKACSRVIGDFDAEGLGNLIWSIAALQCIIPEREWMREFVGSSRARMRSFLAVQLVQLVEGLAVLGYTPRDELCNAILGQIRRQMHTMSGAQMCVVLRAIAIAPRWTPYRQFLYDFVEQSQPKFVTLSASQASGILWAFAKFGFLPEPTYTAALATQVALALPPRTTLQSLPAQSPSQISDSSSDTNTQPTQLSLSEGGSAAAISTSLAITTATSTPSFSLFSGADGDDLSMALWALAELQASEVLHTPLLVPASLQTQQQQQQSTSLSLQQQQTQQQWTTWIEAWLDRASVVAHGFSGPAAANSMWALGKLGIRPPPALLDALLLRVSTLLPELSPKDMTQVASALVALQYRPSDAWLTAFVSQSRTHLAALTGDDLGLLLWSLSLLGTPMNHEWLLVLCREAARGWSTHTGESLGLMAWGLSQYNFSPFSHSNPDSGPAPAALAAAPGTAQVLELPPTRHDSARLQTQVQQGQQQPQAVLAMSRKEEAWWAGFYRACGEQWHTASPKALTLMLFGVAQLACTAPDREWQRGLMRAIRLRVPRPPTSDAVLPALLMEAGLVAPQQPPTEQSGLGASPHALLSVSERSQSQQTQQRTPPSMSTEAVLAALPPQAVHSVWLAAFVTELKGAWGFPHVL